ncbi:hypothetical protein ACQEPB_00365 [Novosphingobium fluoreni]|uniref:hypothetical protein n=1 Tax=Novosphingobium fluoreni TaxID=1391222 RepID=UPI003DA0A2EC
MGFGVGDVTGITSLVLTACFWFINGQRVRRGLIPVLHWDGKRLQVSNHLNEYVTIDTISADADLCFGDVIYITGGDITGASYSRSPALASWTIAPCSSERFTLWTHGDAAENIVLCISSSARTLRRRKISVSKQE